MKKRMKISTRFMQGMMMALIISRRSKTGKAVQRQSRRSGPFLERRDSVLMMRSTSQMKSRIMVSISSLNACFSYDFFLLMMLMKVQITKKTAEPMMVCRMNPGDLKAHAYSTEEYPKESQVNRRAGCVRTPTISEKLLSGTVEGTEPIWQISTLRFSAQFLISPTGIPRWMPSTWQILSFLKNMKAPWLSISNTKANRTYTPTVRPQILSDRTAILEIMSRPLRQTKMLIPIWIMKRIDDSRSPSIRLYIMHDE